MPKFVVTTVGTVRYTTQLVLESDTVNEAEALALHLMPAISPSTCEDGDDLNDVEVNETLPFSDDAEEPEPFYHTVHHAARVGRETYSVLSWSCSRDEYRVCITFGPNSQHPDGYVDLKGKFKDLEDAQDLFERLVTRAKQRLA